jgi:hypothetical protein
MKPAKTKEEYDREIEMIQESYRQKIVRRSGKRKRLARSRAT